ncbi:MAG: restriction endonuclease subunit M, partial [Bacteroidales bacterium]|nr:restriction endonuclease subunit M [Bacteroidales bacterium]
MVEQTDIPENDLLALSPDVLRVLLKDHSVSHHFKAERNIFWATADYEPLGEGYGYLDPITPESITGEHGLLIQPRAKKSREVQQQRVQEKAEVFTPAWICNKQNNLIDEAWFGRSNVFNTEHDDGNQHSWETHYDTIHFPETKDKTWQDYVCAQRLEVACGEAPYLTSRYDAVACDGVIPVKERIGLLDRKLRIVGEHTTTSDEWLVWAFNALHATYG